MAAKKTSSRAEKIVSDTKKKVCRQHRQSYSGQPEG